MKISNKIIEIEVSSKGAELQSIKKNNREYLWQADTSFWNRHAPVLFPIVGRVWDNTISINKKRYSLSQHGFARDNEFVLLEKCENKLTYCFSSNETTLQVFPYHFDLHICYELINNVIKVGWKVINNGDESMYFQIGAHPGFYYPDYTLGTTKRGYFALYQLCDTTQEVLQDIKISFIGQNGCLGFEKTTRNVKNGLLEITPSLFDNDALILEDSQVQKITLMDNDKKPYLSMIFDAPVLGLWSPTKKDTPFVCIEPWYGRCDRENFNDDISKKDWINKLETRQTFEKSYSIVIE